jgi:hypothetical protein
MTLKAEAFKLEHLDYFEPQEVGFDVKAMATFALNYPEIRQIIAFTKDSKTIFICGLSFISEGVWEAWLIPCKEIKKYAKDTVRSMKDFTDWLFEVYSAHRIQIAVEDFNCKWAKSIGFQFEGIVKKYHKGVDHYMYIKVRE